MYKRQLILLVGELLFNGLDGIQQEVAVVFPVLDHGHALVEMCIRDRAWAAPWLSQSR